MNSTDYILEAAGVSDVDIMDIEVAQAFAEMAVLEAMMNCYDKQIVLLEYNEDSADEIFTESETFLPGMEMWNVEAWSVNVDVSNNGNPIMKKNRKDFFYAVWDGDKKIQGGFEDEKKAQAYLDAHKPDAPKPVGKRKPIASPGVKQPFKQPDNYTGDMEGPDMGQFGGGMMVDRTSGGYHNKPIEKKAGEKVDNRHGRTGGYNPPYGKAKGAGGSAGAGGSYDTNELMGNMNLDPHGDNPDPRQQQLASDIPTASKKLAFKKFMNKCWSVCVKLVTSIVDAIFAIDFPKLKKTLEAKGAEEIVLNDKELTTLKKMEDLVDIGEQYEQKFGLEFLKANRWSKQATDNAVVGLRMLDKALKEYKVQTPINNDEKNETRVTAKHLAELCDKLGRNDLKKKIRKWGQDVAKHNTDFNAENGIPNQLADELRNFNKTLMKAYSETAKSFQKLLNWCIDIGVAQDKREKHGGVDAGPHAPKEIKAEAREGAKKYREENPSKIQQAFNKLGGNKAAAWAEEGWSMDLSEDEDFF